jgi:hypothetical protein
MSNQRCAAAFLAIVIGVGSAEAAEIVVLESSSPRYVAGQSVDAAQPVTLAVGETLTVATEDGRLARIVGPYTGPAIGSAPDESVARRALAELIAADRPEVGGIGGVRGESPADSPADTRPGIWFVHAERGGEQCALQGQSVQLWREETLPPAVMEIRVSLSDTAALVRWNAGEQSTAWPSGVGLADGTIYLLRAEGAVRSVPVRLHLLPPGLGSPGLATAAWLAARGCTDQARLALR